MSAISRRDLLAKAAAAAAGTIAAPALFGNPLGLPIGCQTYPVRRALAEDFPGTLGKLASIGYTHIEMCSPPGYERDGYAPLVSMTASDMRAAINAAGLRCESCHFTFRELKENLDDRIAWAKELGLRQMILQMFGLPRTATMADWVKAAGELNKIGETVHKAGLDLGFHNHNFEFQQIDGVLVYDRLMAEFDPKLVRMQFQVSVISLGYKADAFMTRYRGRFLSMHLQDWSAAEKKTVAIGEGTVDWPKTFAAAKTGGIKNYFVELDLNSLEASYPYLHKLQV